MTAPPIAEITSPERGSAGTPPERAGLRRDGVRLMVADKTAGTVCHSSFTRIGEFLEPGDVIVVNVSSVIPAAVTGMGRDTGRVRLHLSSPVAGNIWTVEPRVPAGIGSERWADFPGGTVSLPDGAAARLLARDGRSPRLWLTELVGIADPLTYLDKHGEPIRYTHSDGTWPLSDYQNVYAVEPGSSEMPSAGRPFTAELITALVASGVLIAPVVLHAGVASFEAGELPDVERYRVSEVTARVVNEARARGRRVIAVGTTTVRALETMTDSSGMVHPGRGTTDLMISAGSGVAGVDGLVTGWHDDGATHLDLVAAIAGSELLEVSYREAASQGYLGHEFGDSLLVLS